MAPKTYYCPDCRCSRVFYPVAGGKLVCGVCSRVLYVVRHPCGVSALEITKDERSAT